MTAVCDKTELPADQCAHCDPDLAHADDDDDEVGSPGACRSCGADILWVVTVNGKAMPLDPDPVEDGNVTVEGGIATVLGPLEAVSEPVLYVTHFQGCPDADEWRR